MSKVSERESDAGDAPQDDGVESQRAKPFRFKSKKRDRPSDQEEDDPQGRKRSHTVRDSSHRRRKHHHRHHHHRYPGPEDTSHPAFSHPTSRLAPEQAFRESLFDALGDDEGAAFWEGVYGQPIHTYPDTYQDAETGELERMTEDEYAQFVRRKMWEKSWEGIEAAREEQRRQREEEKRRRREEDARATKDDHKAYDDHIFESQIEASLRRGKKRKDRKRSQEMWEDYLRRWHELQILAENRPKTDDGDDNPEQLFLRNKIAWPVESGKRKDVVREEIERFVRKGTNGSAPDDLTPTAYADAIKLERVRWHPDKIQQRYGFMEIDESTLKGVTATFQIFDDIWNDLRNKGP